MEAIRKMSETLEELELISKKLLLTPQKQKLE